MKKRNGIITGVMIAGTLLQVSVAGNAQTIVATERTASAEIRPFKVHVPQKALTDLRNRIAATRWPDHETVSDNSQGIQLEKLQSLTHYWATSYNWRKVENRLNALPQFITNIDGVDIHFIHVRSKEPNALPIIITHGWPGSVLELLDLIGPLTNPVAYGGKAEDAFDVVIPSMPGYGFSGRPTEVGWAPERIGKAWEVLMHRLGYTRYVAQGGDWGAIVTEAMGKQAPAGLQGIHVNLPATIPTDAGLALKAGNPAPAGLTDQEKAVYDAVAGFIAKGNIAYSSMMGAKPQTISYGIMDSPVGLAAWLLGHPGFIEWNYTDNNPVVNLTREQVLDGITLYWLTNTAASSSRLYWENMGRSPLYVAAIRPAEIKVPVGITVFQADIYRAPETWARRAYPTLSYFHEVDKGGHFAAWEQPQLFTQEMRAAFRSLR